MYVIRLNVRIYIGNLQNLQWTLPQPTIVHISSRNVLLGSCANDIVVAHEAGLVSLTSAMSFDIAFLEYP